MEGTEGAARPPSPREEPPAAGPPLQSAAFSQPHPERPQDAGLQKAAEEEALPRAQFRVSYLLIITCVAVLGLIATFLTLISLAFRSASVYAETVAGSNNVALLADQWMRVVAMLNNRDNTTLSLAAFTFYRNEINESAVEHSIFVRGLAENLVCSKGILSGYFFTLMAAAPVLCLPLNASLSSLVGATALAHDDIPDSVTSLPIPAHIQLACGRCDEMQAFTQDDMIAKFGMHFHSVSNNYTTFDAAQAATQAALAKDPRLGLFHSAIFNSEVYFMRLTPRGSMQGFRLNQTRLWHAMLVTEGAQQLSPFRDVDGVVAFADRPNTSTPVVHTLLAATRYTTPTPEEAELELQQLRSYCYEGSSTPTVHFSFALDARGFPTFRRLGPDAGPVTPSLTVAPFLTDDSRRVCGEVCEIPQGQALPTRCPPSTQHVLLLASARFTTGSSFFAQMLTVFGWGAVAFDAAMLLLLYCAVAVPITFMRARATSALRDEPFPKFGRVRSLLHRVTRRVWIGELQSLLLATGMVRSLSDAQYPFLPEHMRRTHAPLQEQLAEAQRLEERRMVHDDDGALRETPLDGSDGAGASAFEGADAQDLGRLPGMRDAGPHAAGQMGAGVMSHVGQASLLVLALDFVDEAYVEDFAAAQRLHREAFAHVASIVRRYGGVMLFLRTACKLCVSWNTFEQCGPHATLAVKCALELVAAVVGPLRSHGLSVGVGVSTGPLIGGFLGDHQSLSNVLLGDTLSAAVALADLHCRTHEATLLVADAVREATATEFDFIVVDSVTRMAGPAADVFDVRRPVLMAEQGVVPPLRSASEPEIIPAMRRAFASFKRHAFDDALLALEPFIKGLLAIRQDDAVRVRRLVALCRYGLDVPDALPRPYTKAVPVWGHDIPYDDSPPAVDLGASVDEALHTVVGRIAAKEEQPAHEQADFRANLQAAMRQHQRQASSDLGTDPDLGPDGAVSASADAPASTRRPPSTAAGSLHKSSSACDEEQRESSTRTRGLTSSDNIPGSSPGTQRGDMGDTLLEPLGQTVQDWNGSLGGQWQGTLIPEGELTEAEGTFGGPGPSAGAAGPTAGAAPSGQLPTTFRLNTGTVIQRSAKLIGRGSYGIVYMGMEQHSGRLVALKFMPLPTDKDAVAGLENEVGIMEKVRDVNVVDYYGYAIDPASSRIVLVMECIVAGSLHTLLQSFSQMPQVTTVNFMRNILHGLHKLHAMGIMHRDVKPQNVLVTTNGQCKLTDFGASAMLTAMARQEHELGAVAGQSDAGVMGTPLYLAPEAARGHATFKSDIWAVGIMFLQLTTGKVPYPIDLANIDPMSFIWRIGSGMLRPEYDAAALSQESVEFVRLCLDPEVATRPTAAELLESKFLKP